MQELIEKWRRDAVGLRKHNANVIGQDVVSDMRKVMLESMYEQLEKCADELEQLLRNTKTTG